MNSELVLCPTQEEGWINFKWIEACTRWHPKIFFRRIGLLLYSVSDLFPLTIPRWRWGMRILQGKSSLPLGNNPRPGGFIKILPWSQGGRWTLKTTTTLQRRTWATAHLWHCSWGDHHFGPSGPQSISWSLAGEFWQSFTYICQDGLGCLWAKTQNKLFEKINRSCMLVD